MTEAVVGFFAGEGMGGTGWSAPVPVVLNGLAGIVAGALVFACVQLVQRAFRGATGDA